MGTYFEGTVVHNGVRLCLQRFQIDGPALGNHRAIDFGMMAARLSWDWTVFVKTLLIVCCAVPNRFRFSGSNRTRLTSELLLKLKPLTSIS